MTTINIEEIQSKLAELSLADRAKLINGISMEAALILKKILPDSPILDALIATKSRLERI